MPLDFLNKLGIRPPPINVRTLQGIGKDLGLFNSSAQHKNQNYNALKTACLQSGTLFEDDQFPCDPRTLFYTDNHGVPVQSVQWLRPKVLTYHLNFHFLSQLTYFIFLEISR